MFDSREKTALVVYPQNQADKPVTQSNDCVRRSEAGEGSPRKYITGYKQKEKGVQGDRDGKGKRIQHSLACKVWRDSSCITVLKQIC